MTNKKLGILVIAFILISSICVSLYGKFKLKHINMDEYNNKSLYHILEKENYSKMYFDLDKLFNDEYKLQSIDKLIDFSDLILIIEKIDNKILGNAVINNCKILKIFKGANVKINSTIQIYDLNSSVNLDATGYLDGITPLKAKNKYIVFLKENKNKKNTYHFSSTKYGHINLDYTKCLERYEQYSLTLNEISNYDYIFLPETSKENIDSYKETVNSILKKFDKKN